MTDAKKLQGEIQKRSLAKLGPLFSRYQLDHDTLESALKWKSIVLLLGNFSSGKSTLINELFGTDIQRTGQSPTDDSFTILTAPEGGSAPQEVPGSSLLNNDRLPFTSLKKYGEQFAAHFTMKQVDSPQLENMAIIDTPGMLDAVTEKDRGYDYNGVVGDLGRLADLVVLMFDPHKAGTIREVYETIRNTLPGSSGEDRVIFVMSRIDECDNPADLIRSYGTLCWNLSQMTGRKDIPMIHLTYSPRAAGSDVTKGESGYLHYLENQREELKAAILQAPRHRLDNLAAFVEIHSERLAHLLEALTNYRRMLRRFRFKFFTISFLISLGVGAGATLFAFSNPILSSSEPNYLIGGGVGVGLLVLFFWGTVLRRVFTRRFNQKRLAEVDSLTTIENQTRRDSWYAIKDYVYGYMRKTGGNFSLRQIRQEYRAAQGVFEKGSKEIREALNELATIRYDENLANEELDARMPAFLRKPEA